MRRSTVVGTGVPGGQPAVIAGDTSTGTVNAQVRDTIIAGYGSPLRCDPNGGTVTLGASYSYLPTNPFEETSAGTCVTPPFNNLNSDVVGAPQFVGATDYHLSGSSPAIDQGDPDNSAQPTEDFDLRAPIDGNLDGIVRRDIGAFEFVPSPAPPGGGGSGVNPGGGGNNGGGGNVAPPKDTKAPTVSKPKFAKGFSAKKGGSLTLTLSEAANVELTFTPAKKTKKKPKPVELKFKGKAGSNKFKIKSGKLGAKRYKVGVRATDPAGNRSATASSNLTVKK
jgi:hypothetical protein